MDASQALAEAKAEERGEAEDPRLRHQLATGDVTEVVGRPTLSSRACALEREALLAEAPVMDDERHGDQHQRGRGEPVHPHQHSHQ